VNTKLQPELGPLRVQALDLLSAVSLEAIAATELEVLALAERMLQRLSRKSTLTAPVVLARGLPDAVDTKIRSLRYKLDAPTGGWMDEVYVVANEGDDEWGVKRWETLRVAIASAEDSVYDAARERARQQWRELSRNAKSRVAFAFESERWADELFREVLADPSGRPADLGFLACNCHDVEVVRAYVSEGSGSHAVANAALELAVRIGPDVVDVLASTLPELLTKPKYGPLLKTPPREVVEAIGCFHTKTAARALAAYAGHRILAPQVAAYFQRVGERVDVLEEDGACPAARKLAQELRAARHAREDVTQEAKMRDVPVILQTCAWRPKRCPPGRAPCRRQCARGTRRSPRRR